MSKLIIKADSGIKFDKTRRYIGKNKNFGKGVWFRDTNNDGKWNKGESLITPGNRIRNNDFSYSQLNSDGTITKLADKNGNVTKGLENKVSDADKYAFKHKLVYGRQASYNDKTKKWERNNNTPILWDIDTERSNDKDIYNNGYGKVKHNGHTFDLITALDKDYNPTTSESLVPKYNAIFKFDKNNNMTSESGNLADKLLNIKPKAETALIAVPQDTGVSSTFWDLNPDGGSVTRGKTKLTYGQIDDGEGLNGSGYNDVDDAYREAWLAVNPLARAHGKWFLGHLFWRTDRALDIKDDYVKLYESDLNKWLQHHYAINPDQNKAVLNADHKYLRKFVLKNDKGIDTNYVPLFTGNLWGFGVREGMDANGNTTYTDYNGDEIPGLIFKDGKPYIPADTPKNYYKLGGKLIKRLKGYRENLIKLGHSKNNIKWDPSIKSKGYSTSGWYYDLDNNGKFDPYKDLFLGKSNTLYIIKSGDNLSSIAKSHNTDINTLLKLNPLIKNPNFIGINSIIKLPIRIINTNNNSNSNFNNYQVKSGDTLFKIATNNNTTVLEILKNNSGLNPNLIKPGQSIKLIKRNIYKPKILNWKDILNYENNINKLLGADLINTFKLLRPTGTPYIIDDKKNGKLNVYIDGKLIKSFNALHGANGRASKELLAKWKQLNIAEEDDYTKTYVDKNGKTRNGAGNMSTPAGIFYTDSSGTYNNVPSFMRRDIDMLNSNNPNGIASSIHYRDMARSNVTNGCTGMSAKDLNSLALILKGYKHVETYILPDNPNNGKFFIRNGKINFSSNRRTMLQNGIAKGFRSNINIKFDGIDNNGLSYGSDRINKTNRFISGLTKYKKQLMNDLGINDDTYNNLSLASLGILGRETSYGNTHNAIGNFSRAVGKFFNHNSSSPDYISKYSIYGANLDNNSIGLTLMRISLLDRHSRELLNKYHITKDDLVYNPEKAAIATMIKLGLEYRNLGLNIDKAIASWNNRPGYVNSVKLLINNDFNLYTNY